MIDELVIHAGDCKTGSSAIQAALRGRRWTGDVARVAYPTRSAHNDLAGTMVGKGKPGQADKILTRLNTRFSKRDGGLGVISAEHFEYVPPERLADALARNMPDLAGSVRVVAYVRPHAERLMSSYSERLKLGRSLDTPMDLYEQFDRNGRLDYAQRFGAWRGVFGDRFTLRPYTRSTLLDGDVVRDFLEYLFQGAPVTVTDSADTINPSLSVEDLALLCDIHAHLRAKGPVAGRAATMIGRHLAGLFPPDPAVPRTKLKIDRALAARLQERYATDAAALDAAFFDGTPISDALARAGDGALEAPQDMRAETWFSPETLRYARGFAEAMAMTIEREPRWAARAARPPELRPKASAQGKTEGKAGGKTAGKNKGGKAKGGKAGGPGKTGGKKTAGKTAGKPESAS